jgi:hypothetical protein
MIEIPRYAVVANEVAAQCRHVQVPEEGEIRKWPVYFGQKETRSMAGS